MHIFAHIHMNSYVHLYTQKCAHVCIYMHKPAHIYSCIYQCTHKNVHKCVSIFSHMHIYIHASIHTNMCMHMYLYAHTHVYQLAHYSVKTFKTGSNDFYQMSTRQLMLCCVLFDSLVVLKMHNSNSADLFQSSKRNSSSRLNQSSRKLFLGDKNV